MWSPVWNKTPLKNYLYSDVPMNEIVNERFGLVTLYHVFTSDRQIFLLKAIIGMDF